MKGILCHSAEAHLEIYQGKVTDDFGGVGGMYKEACFARGVCGYQETVHFLRGHKRLGIRLLNIK